MEDLSQSPFTLLQKAKGSSIARRIEKLVMPESPSIPSESAQNPGGASPGKPPPSYPLHITILSLVVFLVVITAFCIGGFTFLNTRNSIRQLSDDLIRQIAVQTVAKTENFLQPAAPALTLTRELMQNDPACAPFADAPFESPAWKARANLCLRILRGYPDFRGVYYGDRKGYFTAARRSSDPRLPFTVEHRWRVGQTTAWRIFTVTDRGEWKLDTQRTFHLPPDQAETLRKFVPSERPWYRQAAAQNRFIWTAPYPFASISGSVPGITAALPLPAQNADANNGDVAGVFGIDIELQELSDFVRSFHESGQSVYILSQQGNDDVVLAQPGTANANPLRLTPGSGLTLPSARTSADPLLHTLAPRLLSSLPSARHSRRADLDFAVDGERYLGAYQVFHPGSGESHPADELTWKVVIAVPEQSVNGVVWQNTRFTLFICALALVFSVAFGIYLSVKLARPLGIFADEMRKVGDFEISETPLPTSRVHEIRQMSDALTDMKASIASYRKYVSTDLTDQIKKTRQIARLGGETARITVLFADIIGFTAVSEQMTPQELVGSLADYFAEMEHVIAEQEGFLDKYQGDSVMAFWGGPLYDADAPEKRACSAALEYGQRFQALRTKREAQGRIAFDAGIGIHTGEAVVGNIGSPERMSYTAMGDAVNVTSRLQGLNRAYDTRILLSETTYQGICADFETRPIDLVTVKGRKGAVQVYELLARKGELDAARRELRDCFTEALRLYHARQWEDARKQFQQALSLAPNDGPSRVFSERCAHYVQSPPPADWNGVFAQTEK